MIYCVCFFHTIEEGLTVLAVDTLKAWLALADVLAKDVTSTRLTSHFTNTIISARVGNAGPFCMIRKTQSRTDPGIVDIKLVVF